MERHLETQTIIKHRSRVGIADIVSRVWARDYSLWPESSSGGGGDWMGWLDLAGSNTRFPRFAREMSEGRMDGLQLIEAGQSQRVDLDGITSLNVLGMGGSSLTPEVLSHLFPSSVPALNVLDTINPATVNKVLGEMDLDSAVFAVASKSGTTIEPLSLERVFRNALRDVGIINVASHFVAISDRGTPLSVRASEGEFALHIETPVDVGGRFSALSAFGMFPADICNMPMEEMIRRAIGMSERCRIMDETNPGVDLGLFMARHALMGRDKVTFAMSSGLERFGLWLEQLLAESTGKNDRGLIPITGEPLLPSDSYGRDRQFIRITLAGEGKLESTAFNEHPTYDIELPNRSAIAGEFFRWEFATAVAACAIGVYPFDQPDVESAKQLARMVLESTDVESDISTTLRNAVNQVLQIVSERGYVAIAAFLPESDELSHAVSDFRAAISNVTGMATTFGYGPRYLHSTGQLHKGGPSPAMVLVFTQQSASDIEVPGESYSLGDLSEAQAIGDVQALRNKGRRAELVKLDRYPVEEIKSLTAAISS